VFTARYGPGPYIIHTFRFVFITEVESVYSAVRTESLYSRDMFRLGFITEMSVYSAVRTESLYNTDTFRLGFINAVESVYRAVRN
jgi:hypothetical protein